MTGKRSRIISLATAGAVAVAGAIAAVTFPGAASTPSTSATAAAGTAFANLDAAEYQQVIVSPAQHAQVFGATRLGLEPRQLAFKQAAGKAAGEKSAARKAAPKPAKRRATRRAHAAAAAPARSPQQVAKGMLGQFGWSGSQFTYLDQLWGHESRWSVSASNPSSGAYGIPQALPGNRMASAGSDWQSSAATQIRWGMEYIQSTYGSPAAAWAHEEADGWY